MNQIKHSPAPWDFFVLDRPLEEIPSYVDKCIKASGGADFYFVACQLDDGPADVCHVGNGPSGAANARLISAAPDLLAACKRALEAWTGEGPPIDLDDLRLAIAKAGSV